MYIFISVRTAQVRHEFQSTKGSRICTIVKLLMLISNYSEIQTGRGRGAIVRLPKAFEGRMP